MQDAACVMLGRDLPADARVRVGIAVSREGVPVWVAGLIQQLRSVPAIHINGVVVCDSAGSANPGGSLFELYRKWAVGRAPEDPSRLIPLETVLGDLRAPTLPLAECPDLDVLLWLAPLPREGDCSKLARFGVWSFAWTEPDEAERNPMGFWEIYKNEPISTLLLRAHLERFEKAQTLYRYQGATNQSWVYLDNAMERYRTAPVMLLRRLLDLVTDTPAFGEPAHTVIAPGPLPGNLTTGGYVLQQMRRSLSLRWRNRGAHWEWFAAHRPSFGDPWNPTAAPYAEIVPPPGHSYSDPFILRWRDRSVVFLEDIVMTTGRGRLIALELTDEGHCSEPVVILDKPYHLSYPCVFAGGNDMFLIPESSEDRTVQLYRATRFPYEWQCEKILQDQVQLVDTTPYYDNGIWYFFTASIAAGLETLLFYASSLDGGWTYHPRNPICSDVRHARPAGALAWRGQHPPRERKRQFLRPAQDCSIRYGYAVALNEVTRLSQREYAEKQIGRIEPTWRKGLECTHTINSDGFHDMIDAVRWTRGAEEEQ